MTTSDWLQVSLPRADLLLGRQEAEHPRVQEEEGAGGDAAREYPEDAGRQRGVQTSARLQVGRFVFSVKKCWSFIVMFAQGSPDQG